MFGTKWTRPLESKLSYAVQRWTCVLVRLHFPLWRSNKLIENYIIKLTIYYFNSILNIRASSSQFLMAEVFLLLGTGAHSNQWSIINAIFKWFGVIDRAKMLILISLLDVLGHEVGKQAMTLRVVPRQIKIGRRTFWKVYGSGPPPRSFKENSRERYVVDFSREVSNF